MPKVIVSEEVVVTMEIASGLPFKDTSTQVAFGWYEITVRDELVRAMNQKRIKGETDEALFRRLLLLPAQKLN